MLKTSNKTKYYLFCLISMLYIFRGILIYFNVEKVIYLFSAFALFYYAFKYKKQNLMSKYMLIYVFSIIISLVFSFISTNFIISLAGFLSAYLNFFIAFFLLGSMDAEEKSIFLSKYLDFLVFLSVVSSILGIYQTFFDASIFGFASNDIYGDANILATGRYTIRATALLGSAQNYGLFTGATFCLALFKKNKTKVDYCKILVILIGILVSGSRSASICVIIATFVLAFTSLKNKNRSSNFVLTKKTYLIVFMIIILLIPLSIIIIPKYFDSKTTTRLMNFDITPALIVYKESFKSITTHEFFIGSGLGYRDWVVNQLVGSASYIANFGSSYTSSESYFMLSFLQSGIFRVLAIITVMLGSMLNSHKLKEYGVLTLLMCLFINQITTPSFSGMAMSFIFYPIIIYFIICKNSIFN